MSTHLIEKDKSPLWVIVRPWLSLARGAIDLLAPFADLLVRLSLAQAFFVSGLLKVADWSNALYLAANEYPVSWLDPVSAAYLGAAVELICPIFLAAGLFTRLAALPMLALALIIQFSYRSLDTNLFWAALLGWYAVHGPGALSLDRRLVRGLASSALPFAAFFVRIGDWLGRTIGPVFRLILRLWLAWAFAGLPAPFSIFPAETLEALHRQPTAAIAPLLALGLATRFTALAAALAFLGLQTMGDGAGVSAYAWMTLLILGTSGPGPLSLDHLAERLLRTRLTPQSNPEARRTWPHVVIVGAGFGGLACAVRLRALKLRITLIDRRNYHLFQPLLYQVATASLSPGDIATPIRSLFRDDLNIRVLRGEVTGVDTRSQTVIADGRAIPYDFLVLATGASHSYFGKDQWAPFAPGLKRIEDATDVRARILCAFERAEATDDPVERERLLTFLIVGGGPTGVELAGAVAELARHGLEKEFRSFDPASAKIILIQSAPRILPSFPEKLSAIAKASLEALGVEVRLGGRVEMIDSEGVTVRGSRIHAATVLWAAGVVASPAAAWLGTEPDNVGRVKVNADLSVPGRPNILVIGDTAAIDAWNGQPVPGLAPAAKQGGEYAAAVIRARLLGIEPPPAFRYRHRGSLATIGRKSAVADFGRIRLSGAVAWWFWGLVHVYFLVGLRNRLSVMFDWFWAYLTYGVGIRLITGEQTSEAPMTRTIPFSKAS